MMTSSLAYFMESIKVLLLILKYSHGGMKSCERFVTLSKSTSFYISTYKHIRQNKSIIAFICMIQTNSPVVVVYRFVLVGVGICVLGLGTGAFFEGLVSTITGGSGSPVYSSTICDKGVNSSPIFRL